MVSAIVFMKNLKRTNIQKQSLENMKNLNQL